MKDSVKYVGSDHIRSVKSLHLRRRCIENYRFLLVESGEGEFVFPRSSYPVRGRSLLLLAPGERETRYRTGETVSYLYIEFYSDAALIGDAYHECPPASPHFQTVVEILWSVFREKGKGMDTLIAAAVDLALLPSGSRGRNSYDERIQRGLKYADMHLAFPLTVGRLAEEAGLSIPQFRRLFRDALGIAPKRYLMQERMRYAQRILKTEGLRVGEVADLLHFETVFQFSNQYKKVHGHSPVSDRPVLSSVRSG